MTPHQCARRCELVVDTDDLSEDIDKVFMKRWRELNWFCGVASDVYVREAAHNHSSGDWQLAAFHPPGNLQYVGNDQGQNGPVLNCLHMVKCLVF